MPNATLAAAWQNAALQHGLVACAAESLDRRCPGWSPNRRSKSGGVSMVRLITASRSSSRPRRLHWKRRNPPLSGKTLLRRRGTKSNESLLSTGKKGRNVRAVAGQGGWNLNVTNESRQNHKTMKRYTCMYVHGRSSNCKNITSQVFNSLCQPFIKNGQ